MAKKTKHQKSQAMRITQNRKKQIQSLSLALAVIIPATGKGRFSLERIAKETHTKEFFKTNGNKHQIFQYYFEGLFRRHPRKPKTVVLRIAEDGSQWLANKHREFTKEMRMEIINSMEALGFRLQKEILAIKQPEFKKKSYPKDELRIFYDNLEMHSMLQTKVKDLYFQGDVNEAIRYGTELFEKYIRDESNLPSTSAVQLMSIAFDEQNPKVKITNCESKIDKGAQRGFKNLAMGAMGFIRNAYTHGDAAQLDFLEGFKVLCFLSYLFETTANRP